MVTNGGVDKSYRSVLMMPIMRVYLTLMFIFIKTIISKAKQQVSAENSKESMYKNVIFRKSLLAKLAKYYAARER
ncbi:hypothetical protein JCM21714_3874 [Gracilibacillus boraciitolerans JCM 21714]|uniref:Uncharacterized protein n=1 Tax=Gracilibacillus boraciitolerans JCM 21714 TaxID=1298598 RepID=W4VPC3_9BACI|nr:hypothetical protein JCM21714_3874 [Gracilibacillus boraciitolerans JCM 21714]